MGKEEVNVTEDNSKGIEIPVVDAAGPPQPLTKEATPEVQPHLSCPRTHLQQQEPRPQPLQHPPQQHPEQLMQQPLQQQGLLQQPLQNQQEQGSQLSVQHECRLNEQEVLNQQDQARQQKEQ